MSSPIPKISCLLIGFSEGKDTDSIEIDPSTMFIADKLNFEGKEIDFVKLGSKVSKFTTLRFKDRFSWSQSLMSVVIVRDRSEQGWDMSKIKFRIDMARGPKALCTMIVASPKNLDLLGFDAEIDSTLFSTDPDAAHRMIFFCANSFQAGLSEARRSAWSSSLQTAFELLGVVIVMPLLIGIFSKIGEKLYDDVVQANGYKDVFIALWSDKRALLIFIAGVATCLVLGSFRRFWRHAVFQIKSRYFNSDRD